MCFGLTSLSLIALDQTENNMFVVLNQELSPRYTLKTVKHGGGNVIVWGSFLWCGVGPLHRIQGTIDQHMYKEILENVMLTFFKSAFEKKAFKRRNNSKQWTQDRLNSLAIMSIETQVARQMNLQTVLQDFSE